MKNRHFLQKILIPISQIKKIVKGSKIIVLIYNFLKHSIYRNAYYVDVKKGISRGTSLSPLLGAIYLKSLDNAMDNINITYVRFVNDWVLMANTPWTFGIAVKKVNRIKNKEGNPILIVSPCM